MGYNLYITRSDAPFGDGIDGGISLQEWKDHVASDSTMRLDGFAEFVSPEGWSLRTVEDGIAVWTAYSGHGKDGNMAWFSHDDGRVVVKNPDEEIVAKMFDIAEALGAKLIGEEGERYGRDGSIVSEPEPYEEPDAEADRVLARPDPVEPVREAVAHPGPEARSRERPRRELPDPLLDPELGSHGYYIYRNLEYGTLKVSRRGWNWPAFFFGQFYLLYIRMFGLFGILLAASFSLRMFTGVTLDKPVHHLVMAVVGIGIRLFLGHRVNALRRDRLAADDPQVGILRADNEDEALRKAQVMFG